MFRFKKYITEIKDYQHDVLHPPEDHLLSHEKMPTGDPDHFAHAHNALARYYHHLTVLGPKSTEFFKKSIQSGLVYTPHGMIRPGKYHPETGEEVSPEKLVHPTFTMLPHPVELGFKTAKLGKEYLTHLRNADKQANGHIVQLSNPNLRIPPRVRLHHIIGLNAISDQIKELADSHAASMGQMVKQPHIIRERTPEGVALEELSVPRIKQIHHFLRGALVHPPDLVDHRGHFEVHDPISDRKISGSISSLPEHDAKAASEILGNEAQQRLSDIHAHEYEERQNKLSEE